MLVVVLVLMLVGFGMLVLASLSGTVTFAWGAVLASLLGAAVLVSSWRQRAVAAEGQRADQTLLDSPRRADEVPWSENPVPQAPEYVRAQPVPAQPVQSSFATPEPPASDSGQQRADPSAASLVALLDRQVLVVDGQPAYHLPGCPVLSGQRVVGLPVKEAVELDFTPCAVCTPLRVLTNAGPSPENFAGRRR